MVTLPVVIVPPDVSPAAIDRSARGNTAWTEGIVEGDERLPVHGLVNQSAAAAQHSLPVTGNIPCEAKAGTEVLMIRVVEAADLMADLHHSLVWIEIAQQIVSFLRHAAELIANAEIDRQILVARQSS